MKHTASLTGCATSVSNRVPATHNQGDFSIMATPKNHNKPWTAKDQRELSDLARQNTPTRVIGIKLGRTPDAVASQASQQGTSLKPANQTPYNRRRK